MESCVFFLYCATLPLILQCRRSSRSYIYKVDASKQISLRNIGNNILKKLSASRKIGKSIEMESCIYVVVQTIYQSYSNFEYAHKSGNVF